MKLLINQLFSVESEISYNLDGISDRENWIAELNVLIQEEAKYIEEIESEIAQCYQNLATLETEKENLIKQRQDLGEY